MDMKTVKQYRNLIFTVMGVSFIVSMVGLVTMIATRGDDGMSVVLTKVGIVGVMVSYALSLYIAVMRREHLARATKILLWALVALSAPVAYGLVALLFVM